jgi:glycolate oxidase FAD binding subunit
VVDIATSSAQASAERFQTILNALASSQLTPTAVEVQTHPMRLLVRFESIEAAAEQQAAQAADLARAHGAGAANVAGGDEAALWSAHNDRPWLADGAIVKVTLRPSDIGPALAWVAQTLRDADWEAIGRAAIGVLLLRVGGDAARQAAVVEALRERLPQGQGSAVVVRGSDELKRAIDVWGPPGDALPLMRAIKQQFDPEGVLNPGRGPFGI